MKRWQDEYPRGTHCEVRMIFADGAAWVPAIIVMRSPSGRVLRAAYKYRGAEYLFAVDAKRNIRKASTTP